MCNEVCRLTCRLGNHCCRMTTAVTVTLLAQQRHFKLEQGRAIAAGSQLDLSCIG